VIAQFAVEGRFTHYVGNIVDRRILSVEAHCSAFSEFDRLFALKKEHKWFVCRRLHEAQSLSLVIDQVDP